MIFSHVLYQLSYPAGGRERFYGTGWRLSSIRPVEIPGRTCSIKGSYPASAKRSSSKADSTISLGSAPTTALGCSPGSKNAIVGMLEIPK
jgi:hypothetical protein